MLKKEYDHLAEEMNSFSSGERHQSASRRLSELSPIVEKFNKFLSLEKRLADATEILAEDQAGELSDLAREELKDTSGEMEKIKSELHSLLSSREGREDSAGNTVIVEIRAGAGGEEASLFAKDLSEMYSRFAEKNGWKREIISYHESDMGGFKEVIFALAGKDVYRLMRHEGGVHRVQRVPVTESGGRIHTSTVTVAVLPERKEGKIEINPKDLKVDIFRASGPGGQHVNVTDSAVRLTHLPTGITVRCQDERSQHQNRAKAMRVLMAKLTEHFKREKEKQLARQRSEQVMEGDRSQKIRTYNFPQNRVTDHRINLRLHKLQSILKGDLSELFEALQKKDEQNL